MAFQADDSSDSADVTSDPDVDEELPKVHAGVRYVGLRFNLFDCFVALSKDPSLGNLPKVAFLFGLWSMVGAIFWMIYKIRAISHEDLDERVCQCSPSLQCLCTFVFCSIIWEDISYTLDTLELLVMAPSTPEEYQEKLRLKEKLAASIRGTVTTSDFAVVSPCESPGHRKIEGDWHFCESSIIFTDEAVMSTRQYTGFDICFFSKRLKIILVLLVVLPKLVTEVALFWGGSYYVMVSHSDEDVITSVVSVDFILRIDNLLAIAYLPARLGRAMNNTSTMPYVPSSRLTRCLYFLRVRMHAVIDPLIAGFACLFFYSKVSNSAGCENDWPWVE